MVSIANEGLQDITIFKDWAYTVSPQCPMFDFKLAWKLKAHQLSDDQYAQFTQMLCGLSLLQELSPALDGFISPVSSWIINWRKLDDLRATPA